MGDLERAQLLEQLLKDVESMRREQRARPVPTRRFPVDPALPWADSFTIQQLDNAKYFAAEVARTQATSGLNGAAAVDAWSAETADQLAREADALGMSREDLRQLVIEKLADR